VITNQQDAARALANCFLANADAGRNAANDELIAELLRHQRLLRERQKADQLSTVHSLTCGTC
jgi:hypothetical protein